MGSSFSFGGEEEVDVEVCVTGIKDEELYDRVKLDSVTKYMKRGWSITRYLANYAKSGDAQFRNYYNEGKYNFIDGLPHCELHVYTMPIEEIYSFIRSQLGDDILIASYQIYVNPNIDDWIKFQLQENYTYSYEHNTLVLDNKYYFYSNYAYNGITNKYDLTFIPLRTKKHLEYEINEYYVETADTYDIQHEVVSKRTIETLVGSGYTILDQSDEITHTQTNIPHGTGTKVYVKTVLSEETLSTGTDTEITLSVDTYPLNRRYLIVQYIKNEEQKIWLHDTSTSGALYDYTDITINSETDKKIEVYPIATIRIWNNNINSDKESERYKSTQKLFKKINLDTDFLIDQISQNNLEDVRHVFFGYYLNPYDNDPIVSEVLWEQFDYLNRTCLADIEVLRKVSFLVTEETNINEGYNCEYSWRHWPPEYKEERIGSVGTCTHSINRTNYMKVYEVTQYIHRLENDSRPRGIGFGWKRVTESVDIVVYKDNYYTSSTEYDEWGSWTTYTLHYGTECYRATVVDSHTYTVYDRGSYVYHPDTTGNGEGTYSMVENYPITTPDNPNTPEVPIKKILTGKVTGYGLMTDYTDNSRMERYDDYRVRLDDSSLPSDINGWFPDAEIVIKKQVDKDHTVTYRTYRNGNYYVISRGDGADGDMFIRLIDADHDKQYTFPLFVKTVENLGAIQKTKLLGHVIHITVFTRVVTEIAWYQSTGFHFVSWLVMVVISAVSLGSMTPVTTAGMTATQVLTQIGIRVAIAGALFLALHIISALDIGIEFKIIASVAASLVAMYAGGVFDEFNMMTVAGLLELPAVAMDVYTKDLNKKMQELKKDQEEFTSAYEERMEGFEKILSGFNSGLSTGSTAELAVGGSSIYTTQNIAMTFSPSMFYTLGTTAYLDLDLVLSGTYRSISDYCNNALRLGILTEVSSSEG